MLMRKIPLERYYSYNATQSSPTLSLFHIYIYIYIGKDEHTRSERFVKNGEVLVYLI